MVNFHLILFSYVTHLWYSGSYFRPTDPYVAESKWYIVAVKAVWIVP